MVNSTCQAGSESILKVPNMPKSAVTGLAIPLQWTSVSSLRHKPDHPIYMLEISQWLLNALNTKTKQPCWPLQSQVTLFSGDSTFFYFPYHAPFPTWGLWIYYSICLVPSSLSLPARPLSLSDSCFLCWSCLTINAMPQRMFYDLSPTSVKPQVTYIHETSAQIILPIACSVHCQAQTPREFDTSSVIFLFRTFKKVQKIFNPKIKNQQAESKTLDLFLNCSLAWLHLAIVVLREVKVIKANIYWGSTMCKTCGGTWGLVKMGDLTEVHEAIKVEPKSQRPILQHMHWMLSVP